MVGWLQPWRPLPHGFPLPNRALDNARVVAHRRSNNPHAEVLSGSVVELVFKLHTEFLVEYSGHKLAFVHKPAVDDRAALRDSKRVHVPAHSLVYDQKAVRK